MGCSNCLQNMRLTNIRIIEVCGGAETTLPGQGQGLPDKGRRLMRDELEGHRAPRVKSPHRPQVRRGEGRGLATLILQERVEEVGASPDADLLDSFESVGRVWGRTT